VANGEGITVKDLILSMRVELTERLNRIETKMDLKADEIRVERLDRRLTSIEQQFVREQDLNELRALVTSPEKVKDLITTAMQDSSARGWTNKERWMGVAIFVFGGVNFVVGLLALGPDLIGGK
jgi:hypothetical protein